MNKVDDLTEQRSALLDVLVIGGGPAGAACALWTHQLGLSTLVDAGLRIGGLQRFSPYTNVWMPGLVGRTGQEIAMALHAHVVTAGVPHSLGRRVTKLRRDFGQNVWEVVVESRMVLARRLVIATGSRPRSAGFVESDRVGIGPGMSMELLEVEGRRVAILGGGDNAFDQALFALRRGARTVDIHSRSAPRAQPLLQRQFPDKNVHVGPIHVDLQSMTVAGRQYDVLGVQFGFDANLPPGIDFPLREGCIVVDRSGAVPGHEGLYAAGEVTNYWHPCVTTSYGHGIQVAKSIQAAMRATAMES
jgi:thioredoxin reductase